MFAGAQLEDTCTLAEAGLGAESTLHMTGRLLGGGFGGGAHPLATLPALAQRSVMILREPAARV